LLSFADHSYDVKSNKNKKEFIKDREIPQSYNKTAKEVQLEGESIFCLFYKHDMATVNINMADPQIHSKN
jgi:hypothetical protein